MSKRTNLPLTQKSIPKKPKLDIQVSTEHLNSIHNIGRHKRVDNEDWGDDTDDEILFLATQACEKAETTNLCNISMHTQPANNFIDLNNPMPSSSYDLCKKGLHSKNHNGNKDKSFKEAYEMKIDDIDLSDYCMTGISNMASGEQTRLMLQKIQTLTAENDKLKEEHNGAIEQCLTKDGEVSILRMQLKNIQTQMSLTKSNHVKNQEIMQYEWNEKLKQIKNEVDSFKSQMEFKNLEVINLKEKCKMLESSKMKFVEPIPSTTDSYKWMGFSQKANVNTSRIDISSKYSIPTKEMATQIESNEKQIKLHLLPKTSYIFMDLIKETIFQHSSLETKIIFNSNKESQFMEHSNFLFIRKKMLSNLNNKTISVNSNFQGNSKLNVIFEDLKILMNLPQESLECDSSIKSSLKIIALAEQLLIKSIQQIQELSKKLSLQAIREMDESYLEHSKNYSDLLISKDPFTGSCWFKNEQSVDTRRIVKVVAILCEYIKPLADYITGVSESLSKSYSHITEDFHKKCLTQSDFIEINCRAKTLLDSILEMCKLIGNVGCSHLYIGVLSSMCHLVRSCLINVSNLDKVYKKIFNIIKEMLFLRPHARIIFEIMCILRQIYTNEKFLKLLCNGTIDGKLQLDYSEGVTLYDCNTCSLQLLCNNIEVWSFNFIELEHIETIFTITQNMLELLQSGRSANVTWAKYKSQHECSCSIRINRCLCVCLHRCIVLYKNHIDHITDINLGKRCNTTIRAGIIMLNYLILNDIEFISRLGDYEGHYQIFVGLCNTLHDRLELLDIHEEPLVNLSESIVPVLDHVEPESDSLTIWEDCFKHFSVTD